MPQTDKIVEFVKNKDPRLQAAIDIFNESDDISPLLDRFIALIDEGYSEAYYFVGTIYEEGGKEVEKDLEKAFFYYHKSIEERGNVEAYLALGKFFYYGAGIEQNYDKAFEYYSIVDENTDNTIAQLMLGRMYQHGQGTKKDLTKAREYYNKAIVKGNVYALQNLSFLEEEQGNRLKGLWLRLKAGFRAFNIGRKNMKDPRLRRG